MLDLGECFDTFEEAKAGDMGKVFWNEYVGKGEHGHVVVFDSADSEQFCIWSCSLPTDTFKGGYGKKCYPREKAIKFSFCRLQKPENIKRWLEYPSPVQQTFPIF